MSLFYVGHPRETDLALFAGGELGPLSRWRIEKHVQSCETCRTAVADFFHLQGDLEELSDLPSSVDWVGMSLRIRKAVAEAGESQSEPVRDHFFPKPPAWQLGLATAAVICGFIVVRQFPLPVAEEAVITSADEQNAVSREARELEGGEALQADGSAAPSESFSKPSSRHQQRENQPLSLIDAGVPVRAVERAEKFAPEEQRAALDARTGASPPEDRMRAEAPPETEPLRLASDAQARERSRGGAGRDAVSEAGGRAANIPAPSAPTGPLGAQRKDAEMNLALDRRVTGRGILREELDQPIGGKKKASADELRRAKASLAPVERLPASQEEQLATLGASFAMQTAGVGASIAPPTDGSEVVVDLKTDGGVRFRRIDAATGHITITDVYAH